jgi:excisionase family DNA binding protein
MTEGLTLTVSEVAELLRVSRRHVYTSIERDEIPAIILGGRKLIPRSWLNQQLAQDETPARRSAVEAIHERESVDQLGRIERLIAEAVDELRSISRSVEVQRT